MEVIKKGSIEPLLVPLKDRLNNITTLTSVTNLKFDTKKKEDNSAAETGKTIAIDTDYPMWAICEIDTSGSLYDAANDTTGETGEYKLYIKYAIGTEAPILGPIFFRVEDD